MKLLLETARADDVRRALDWGVLDGVVTDLELMAAERKAYRYLVRELVRLSAGPVFVSVTEAERTEMVREGLELARLGEQVVVQLPAVVDGIRAAAELEAQNVRCAASQVLSPAQVLLAARMGVSWVRFETARIDEIGGVGLDALRDGIALLDGYGFETSVLAAGLDGSGGVIEAALIGADAAAVRPQVLETLTHHPVSGGDFERQRQVWQDVADNLPVKRIIRGDRHEEEST